MPRLDIIVPVFNEAASAKAFAGLVERLRADLLARHGLVTHVIIVDDGSQDGSADVLAGCLQGTWDIIRLSRNFGKELAVLAGLDHSRGDFALLMDADLQHSHATAIAMVGELLADPDFDVVYAWLANRQVSWRRFWLARAFFRLINSGQRFDIPENAGDFRVMRAPVVQVLRSLRDKRRFNKGLYAWAGFRQKAHPYTPEQRVAGTSKWSRLGLLALSVEAIKSFSVVPLRLLAVGGIAVALAGLAYGVKIIGEVLFYGIAVPGFPSLLVAVVILGGLNLSLLAMIGEYVWVAVSESKDRPAYVVRDVLTPPSEEAVKEPASDAT
jgi:glycosyltransferase involved in cell wall biosynthesis